MSFSITRVTPISPNLLCKANILIDQTGHACLADFGLLTIISDPKYLLPSSSHMQGGTVRWMSPERIAPERFGFKNSRPTIPSDCYALGMVIYETISGNFPFHKDTDLTIFMKVVEGKRPPRGVKFTKSLWGMLEQCWAPQPKNRPSIADILQCLETSSNLLEPPSPGVDEGSDEDSDYWDMATSSPSGNPLDFFATNNHMQPPPMLDQLPNLPSTHPPLSSPYTNNDHPPLGAEQVMNSSPGIPVTRGSLNPIPV